jgi:cob(I)alamin adenosyltransferase
MQYEGIAINELVVKYLNRLSDYLFVLARYTGQQMKAQETIWTPRIR